MIIIIIAAVMLAVITTVFILVVKGDKRQIDLLIQSGAMKDKNMEAADEQIRNLMKKMAAIDKENNDLRKDNQSLLRVINMLLTVSPRYVLQAFADKKLFDLVQKEILVEKKIPFKLDIKYIADRVVDRSAA